MIFNAKTKEMLPRPTITPQQVCPNFIYSFNVICTTHKMLIPQRQIRENATLKIEFINLQIYLWNSNIFMLNLRYGCFSLWEQDIFIPWREMRIRISSKGPIVFTYVLFC